jgi:hypothetical protein
MSIFDRTFLISTGVTAVICGALYYYLNAKIRDLEQALVKQNQVLSSFIANVQQEFRAMAMARAGAGRGANGMTFEIVSGSNELASPEALAAVADLANRKIVITDSDCASETDASASEADSDDSASEADSDDSASDDDSASEAETDAKEEQNKLVICDLSLNDMKVIDMSSLGISQLEIYTPERQSEDEASETDSDSEADESEEDGFHRVSKLVIEEVNLNVLDLLNITSKIEELQVEELSAPVEASVEAPAHTQDETPAPVPEESPAPAQGEVSEQGEAPVPASKEISKYDDLKVDELRKIVLEKGLGQKEEVKKLKKNELLAVLKKNTLL